MKSNLLFYEYDLYSIDVMTYCGGNLICSQCTPPSRAVLSGMTRQFLGGIEIQSTASVVRFTSWLLPIIHKLTGNYL